MITQEKLLDNIKIEHNLEFTMFSQDVCILYSFFSQETKILESLCLSMMEVVK